MVELRAITEDNFLDAFHLKLAPGQESFVSHPIRSLAQAYVYREQCQPFGIYAVGKMVGYVMVIYDYDVPEYDIWHMMIDESMQGLGYGSAALDLVIDYIKNGRPHYYETDYVFLKHMPPFDPIGNENHMQQQLVRYMRKAGIDQRTKKHSGFHSLRHSAGSMLLEMETPLPIITDILGHSDSDVTAVYLKTDLQKLAECVLSPDGFCHE